jgi:hypothetical protein
VLSCVFRVFFSGNLGLPGLASGVPSVVGWLRMFLSSQDHLLIQSEIWNLLFKTLLKLRMPLKNPLQKPRGSKNNMFNMLVSKRFSRIWTHNTICICVILSYKYTYIENNI